MIYLNNPATSKKKPLNVISRLIKETAFSSVGGGRDLSKTSLLADKRITEVQDYIAELFNIKNPERICFTQNCTYALNMAISGVLDENDHVIVTSMDHNSVLRPVFSHKNYTIISADKSGYVNPKDIKKAIKDNTKLIITTHASNVSGTIQDVKEISKIAHKNDALFLLDAAQSAGILEINQKDINADLIAFSGHKGLMGPLGTGGLYVSENVNLKPIIKGGTGSNSKNLSQPDFYPDILHSGTMNFPAISALGDGVKFVLKKGTDKILSHERALASEFIDRISHLENVKILGTKDINKRNGTVAFTIDGIDSQNVAELLLKDYGIVSRGGWHCAYLAHKSLGSEKSGAVRVGFGLYNSYKDVKKLSKAVSEISKSI